MLSPTAGLVGSSSAGSGFRAAATLRLSEGESAALRLSEGEPATSKSAATARAGAQATTSANADESTTWRLELRLRSGQATASAPADATASGDSSAHLLELPEEVLHLLVSHILSPFSPRSASALANCCQSLRRMPLLHESLGDATAALVLLHSSASSLAAKARTSLAEMGSPACSQLRWDWKDLSPSDIDVLARLSRYMPRLRELDLLGNQIGDEGLKALARASARGWLPSLRGLHIGANCITGKGVAALATALNSQPPAFWLLRQVRASLSHHLCLPCLSGLDCSHVPQLYLNHNKIGHDGMMCLALAG